MQSAIPLILSLLGDGGRYPRFANHAAVQEAGHMLSLPDMYSDGVVNAQICHAMNNNNTVYYSLEDMCAYCINCHAYNTPGN